MSRAKKYEVVIQKVKNAGVMPAFLPLIHRHFEKLKPTVVNEREATLTAPVDLLTMMLPAFLVDRIESLEIQYRKGD